MTIPPSPKLTKKHILNAKCCLLFWPKWNRQNHYTHCLGDIKVQQNNEGKYLILAMRAVWHSPLEILLYCSYFNNLNIIEYRRYRTDIYYLINHGINQGQELKTYLIFVKNYRTRFFGQKFYTLKVRKLWQFLPKKKQLKWINISYFSIFVRI